MSNNIELQLADVLRADSVKRWQIVDVLRGQSLAEHTYGVAMIAARLCKRYGMDPAVGMVAALLHDMPEVITGDIPTPVKQVLGVRERIDQIEARIKFVGMSVHDFDDRIRDVVKQADLIEACYFLHHRRGSGQHAESVYLKLVDRLHQWPSAYVLFLELCSHKPVEIDEVVYGPEA